jgi:hypothetical protein
MATNRRSRTDNSHMQDLTSGKWQRVPASTTATVKSVAGRLLRVILNTNGGVVLIRNGSEVIASIAADAAENTFNYGIYCNNSIVVETGANCDVTVVFS